MTFHFRYSVSSLNIFKLLLQFSGPFTSILPECELFVFLKRPNNLIFMQLDLTTNFLGQLCLFFCSYVAGLRTMHYCFRHNILLLVSTGRCYLYLLTSFLFDAYVQSNNVYWTDDAFFGLFLLFLHVIISTTNNFLHGGSMGSYGHNRHLPCCRSH